MTKKTSYPYPGPPPMRRCRFDHQYDPEARKRPCDRCESRAHDQVTFSADSYELGETYEWWTATCPNGRTATFRVPRIPHGRDAAWRLAQVQAEYEKAWDVLTAKYERRFGGNPRRARMYATAAINSEFGPITGLDASGFRPATACEVSCWLHTHREDQLALKQSGEELIRELEGYVA